MAMQGFLQYSLPSRVRPQYQPSNATEMKVRGGVDGSVYVQNMVPNRSALADEGSLFITTNPTPQTVLAYGSAGTQTSFSDTVPFMQIINTGTPGDPNAPIVFPDYLKLIQIGGTAPASTTSVGYAIKLDNSFRAATAGTAVTAIPVGANMNLANPGPAARLVYFTGAVATIPAASAAARLTGRGMLKGGPTLVLDEYTIAWGLVDVAPSAGYLTTVAQYSTRSPAMGIGPGQSMTIHLFFPGGATNAFSYEFEFAHHER